MTKMKHMKTLYASLLIGFSTLGVSRADIDIVGSGENVDMASHVIANGGWGSSWSGVVTDPNWFIIAGPSVTTPYNAFVPQSVPAPYYVGSQSIGGNASGPTDPAFGAYQTGVTVGTNNYKWISPTANANSMTGGTYNWIAEQTFSVSTAGYYNFDFQGAGDNYISFFINGNVDTANTTSPTIVGGTQIGDKLSDFGNLSTLTGTAYLNAGDNTVYMQVTDFGGQTGAIITQSTFAIAPAPEPSTLALAGLGGLSLLWQFRRRK